jgi:hypothetical protein
VGRKSTKQVGALVECHRRKVRGLGIILDKVGKSDTVALPVTEPHNYATRQFRGGQWGWECRSAKPTETFVLVEWFKKPSEYSDDSYSHGARKIWLPIAYLRVVSKAG